MAETQEGEKKIMTKYSHRTCFSILRCQHFLIQEAWKRTPSQYLASERWLLSRLWRNRVRLVACFVQQPVKSLLCWVFVKDAGFFLKKPREMGAGKKQKLSSDLRLNDGNLFSGSGLWWSHVDEFNKIFFLPLKTKSRSKDYMKVFRKQLSS